MTSDSRISGAMKFETDFLANHSDESLLDELRRISSLLPVGESLTTTAYYRLNPKVAYSTVRRRFGGWKEALDRAGLGHLYNGRVVSSKMRSQLAKSLSDQELIDELKRVHILVGAQWLTIRNFNENSIVSGGVLRRRFGSFRQALDLAGIPSHPLSVISRTEQDCFENLAEVWIHYGRAPQYREMFNPPSRIQSKAYMTRWGTWRKALSAFVEWANSDTKVENLADDEPSSTVGVRSKTRMAEADCREVRPGLRFKVFRRDLFRCVVCGRSPATHLNIELHADHIVAVANGGKTTIENLQTLCHDCNLGKGKT